MISARIFRLQRTLAAIALVLCILAFAAGLVWESTSILLFGALGVCAGAIVLADRNDRELSAALSHAIVTLRSYSRGHPLPESRAPFGEDNYGILRALHKAITRLNRRFESLQQQIEEQSAVLANMKESVVAIDSAERVVRINEAARRLLDIRIPNIEGRSLEEVVRNGELQRFILGVLHSHQAGDGEISLYGRDERTVSVHARPMLDPRGTEVGVLVVLSDVTTLRKLESVRREFVANVSHELRTPITAIKGYAETLLDGQGHSPEDARRFLGIIARQADRLSAIVDDLLTLSTIEQEHGSNSIALSPGNVVEVARAAIQSLEHKARERDITVGLEAPTAIEACIHSSLLEQAIHNLIDNAIKYSAPGTVVNVRIRSLPGEVSIEVVDHGCGIEEEHHGRIFERFYRVDKARSRRVGGTGLGLAIVKHIAQAHGGMATVASSPGSGSTFALRIPATLSPAMS